MTTHLIAVHGAGMNAQVWGGMAPHLAAAGYGAHFQAINLPGHHAGDDGSLLLEGIGAMAAFLAGVIDAVPAARDVVLVGHSMGGVVCLAAAHHSRVIGVVAMGVAPHMAVNPALLEMARSHPTQAQEMIVKWGCQASHPQADAVRQVVAQMMGAVPPAALAADLAACDAMAPLPACGRPVLVIAGRDDKMTPAAQGHAVAVHHGGVCVDIDSGHMMPCERAGEVAGLVMTFVAGL